MVKQKFILPIIATIFLFSILPMVLGAWASNLNEGLVAYWDFESNETELIDVYSGINNGTIFGAVLDTGKVGNSYFFNETESDYVEIADNDGFDIDNYTLSGWFKVYDNSTITGTILSKGYHSSEGTSYLFYRNAVGGERWGSYNGGFFSMAYNEFANDIWYHAVMTKNETGLFLYVNGVLVDTWVGTFTTPITAENLTFGADNNDFVVSNFLTGNIDEFAIWNRSLNDSEVAQVYDSYAPLVNDTTPPVVTINSPTATIYDYLITEINFSASDETALDTCWYSLDSGATNTTTPCNTLVESLTTIDNSSYTWIVWASDTSGNEASDSVTFSIDLPAIYITYPEATTYTSQVTELNYLFKDSPETCWYSLDGGATNTTITCGENVTSITSVEGSNTWRVWANNSIGEIFTDSITFSVDLPEPPNPLESNGIYTTMRGAGAGIGIFMLLLGEALPVLLIGLLMVGIVLVVGFAIAYVIKHGIKSSMKIGKGAGK